MQRQQTRYGSGLQSFSWLGTDPQAATSLRTTFRTIPSNALPPVQSYGGYPTQLLAHVPPNVNPQIRNYYGGYPQIQLPLVPTYPNPPTFFSSPPAPHDLIPSSRVFMPSPPPPSNQHRIIAAPPESPPPRHAISQAPTPRPQSQPAMNFTFDDAVISKSILL